MSFINRFIYNTNKLFALLLLLSFVLPFLPPKEYPNISLFSLGISPLIVVNGVFLIYWIFVKKSNIFLSLIVLVFAYFYFGSFFGISSEEKPDNYNNTLKVLSYNVRFFKEFDKKKGKNNIPEIISSFIKKEKPEIIFLQEIYKINNIDFSEYPYQHIYHKKDHYLGHAILSKYPLVNKESFDFEHTYNNTIYADVIKGKDTIRVYNLHLQSLSIKPSFSYLEETDSNILLKTISEAFIKQQEQVEEILKHKEKSKYPVLICGDFNNTQFSYIYRKLSENMKDAFQEKGNGIGTTFIFEKYPMRIDYILASKKLEVLSFKTIDKTFSDHYAISATLGWY